jgi:hypothetical protein
VKLDILPIDQNVIENISRVKLHVLQPGEEEEPLTRKNKEAVSESSDNDSDSSNDDLFPSLSADEMKTARIYPMTVGDIPWEWNILPDGEHITEENPLDLPDKLEFRGMNPNLFDSEENLSDTAAMCFKHVFPDVIGMIKILLILLLLPCTNQQLTFIF